MLDQDATETLVERAYELIRQRIAITAPSSAALLSELSLSRDLAIGRTPVREALQRLAAQGLVTIVPRKGASITRLGREESLQAAELRAELDPVIASIAAVRATFKQREKLQSLSHDLRRRGLRSNPDVDRLVGDAYEVIRDACANPHLQRAAQPLHSVGDRTTNAAGLASDLNFRDRIGDLGSAIAEGQAEPAQRASVAVLEIVRRCADGLPDSRPAEADGRAAASPSLTSLAYLAIEEKIVSGELRPGDWLSQSQLADLLDVGKTTIREASLRLAADHLVEISPRRGIFVAEIDFSDRYHILEARRALERALSKRCASKVTKNDSVELFRLADLWVDAAEKGDGGAVQRIDQTAKTQLLSIAESPALQHAIVPIFTLSRRLYFRMLKRPSVEMARGYSSWLKAIAAGDGAAAAKIAGFIVAEAEHLLNSSRS